MKSENIEFVVAPYEADAQLAYLSSLEAEKGGVAAVITEDSDLVAYGCQAVRNSTEKSYNVNGYPSFLLRLHLLIMGLVFLSSASPANRLSLKWIGTAMVRKCCCRRFSIPQPVHLPFEISVWHYLLVSYYHLQASFGFKIVSISLKVRYEIEVEV